MRIGGSGLLALYAVFRECFPTFQMNVVSPSSGVFGTVFAVLWRDYLFSKRRYPFTRGHSAV